mgnify:CR=1 FL=1
MLEEDLKHMREQADRFKKEMAGLKDRQKMIIEKATLNIMDGKVDLSTEEGTKWMIEGNRLYKIIAENIAGLEFKVRVSEKIMEITDGKGKLNSGKYFELIMSDMRNKKKIKKVMKEGGF